MIGSIHSYRVLGPGRIEISRWDGSTSTYTQWGGDDETLEDFVDRVVRTEKQRQKDISDLMDYLVARLAVEDEECTGA